MTFQHANAAQGRWFEFSLMEQMANIGSEVIRTINWKKRGKQEYAEMAFERALELFDLTLSDPKNLHRLKEVARAREVFVDFFKNDNTYKTTDESWQKYFLAFHYAARA